MASPLAAPEHRSAAEIGAVGRVRGGRRRAASLGVLVAGLLALGACGDDATESVVSDDAAEAGDLGPTTTAEADDVAGDFDDIVLSLEDLPSGWMPVPVEETQEGGSCLDGLTATGGPFDVDAAASSAFARSDLGPFLAAAVVDGAASDVLAELDDVLVSCDGTTGPDGLTTRIEPASIPALPDGSLAVRGTSEDDTGGGVVFTLAGAGTDTVSVLVLAATPLGEIDDEIVATAVNTMIDRAPTGR